MLVVVMVIKFNKGRKNVGGRFAKAINGQNFQSCGPSAEHPLIQVNQWI